MRELDLHPDDLIKALLSMQGRNLCVLDSCGVGGSTSNFLIAGFDPVQTFTFTEGRPDQILAQLERHLNSQDLAAVFTLSYEFGLELNGIRSKHPRNSEPRAFVALFDRLIFHDYLTQRTWLAGPEEALRSTERQLRQARPEYSLSQTGVPSPTKATSNFTRDEYLTAVRQIQRLIRDGETYQANLTQQITVSLRPGLTSENVFFNLRRDNPASFAAFLDRGDSTVVSASPELFLRTEAGLDGTNIIVSPIKGTRPRGLDAAEDELLSAQLLASEKDRAENTMIVDLMRNDIGRVCEFGSVSVDALCRLEHHPTLFHLVSTVRGRLRPEVTYADIIRALFPCGSITGAPKIRTMEILTQLEPDRRGLSMGAIGCKIPGGPFGTDAIFEMSVAIRTMVISAGKAVFNVGGGIVSDSVPEAEYDESLLKAKALLRALGAEDSVIAPNDRIVANN